MKHFDILLLLIFFISTSCSKEDEKEEVIKIEPIIQNISFDQKGGSEKLTLDIDESYIMTYSENVDWLIVHRNANLVSLSVSENEEKEKRTLIVFFKNKYAEIQIVLSQSGINMGDLDETTYMSYNFEGGEQSLSIPTFYEYVIDSDVDWCSGYVDNDLLTITVRKNNNLKKRNANITVTTDKFNLKIAITQSAPDSWIQTIDMIHINNGSFWMGAQSEYPENENYVNQALILESPIHYVLLSAFDISKYEINQAQWTEVMKNNPSSVIGDFLPVNNVSWDEVQIFISKLNERTGLHYRLPTEAEWEYAARGGTKYLTSLFAGSDYILEVGWFYSNSNSLIHEIGQKEPNGFGLYDMSGNIAEWCTDYIATYSSLETNNPTGPINGNEKVIRGGSFVDRSANCRITYRNYGIPSSGYEYVGFRLVLDK